MVEILVAMLIAGALFVLAFSGAQKFTSTSDELTDSISIPVDELGEMDTERYLSGLGVSDEEINDLLEGLE